MLGTNEMRRWLIGFTAVLPIAGPVMAQPIIIPLQPQVQRQPPAPPPPSRVPVVPGRQVPARTQGSNGGQSAAQVTQPSGSY